MGLSWFHHHDMHRGSARLVPCASFGTFCAWVEHEHVHVDISVLTANGVGMDGSLGKKGNCACAEV